MADEGTEKPSRRTLLRPAIPWISLSLGVLHAFIMDRGPRQARIVAIAIASAWFVLLVVRILHRPDEGSRWRVRAWWSTLFATQWAIQLALFFSLPLYWHAWAGTIPQLGFLVLLSATALVSLWDPWTERLLHRADIGALLPAIASFAALNAVLPGLGLSNSQSLWASAIATALVLPIGLVGGTGDRANRRHVVLGTLATMAAMPLALFFGAGRFVPAAPLALMDAAIGTRQDGRGVAQAIERLDRAPAQLLCATSIFAPLGVNERLYHVWRQDGEVRDRIELEISGGREDGFRTWSVKRNFGDDPSGLWSCAVETEMGQSLGARTIAIEP